MRPEEIWCRDEFDAYLAQRARELRRAWTPGADPPDFLLDLNGTQFSVEVSAMVDTVHTGEKALPQPTHYQSTARFVKAIREAAASEGTLSGTFAMWFDGPVRNARKENRRISKAALDYIKNAPAGAAASELDLALIRH